MHRILILIILSLGLWTTCAQAASGLPAYYPDNFGNWGIISAVYGGQQVLVIDDREIRYTVDLQVYTEHTKFETAAALQPGMKVGWAPGGVRSSSQAAVSEIWILPPEYTPLRKAR